MFVTADGLLYAIPPAVSPAAQSAEVGESAMAVLAHGYASEPLRLEVFERPVLAGLVCERFD